MKYTLLICYLFLSSIGSAQVLADFESPETTVNVRGDSAAIVDNPYLAGNLSKKVATYKKTTGNWRQVYFEIGRKVNIKKNTTLSFLIYSTTKGRVFVKLWDGNKLLKEDWAPNYEAKPEENTWTEITFDIKSLQDQDFDRVEIFGSVDNESAATIYLDDLKIFNPKSLNGEPIAKFKITKKTNRTYTFDASESEDLDGTILKYLWRFNDEQSIESLNPILEKTFSKSGNYEVSLEVTDNENKKSINKQSIYVFEEGGFISPIQASKPKLYVNQKIELSFLIDKTYANPYDDEEVSIDAQVTFPDGSKKTIPCYYSEKGIYENNTWSVDQSENSWKLRISSALEGKHYMKVFLTDKNRTVSSETTDFEVFTSNEKGIIEIDKQMYMHRTGESFTPLGINVGWDSMSDYHTILTNLSDAGANLIRYWVVPFNKQALEWKDDGYTHGIGRYSQAAAAFNDSLFTLAESNGIHLQMVLFQHGMFSENVNSNWNDNPYNAALNGPLNKAEEYFYNESAKKSTKKLIRYIIARYGYSPNLFAWELFNEVQFTGVNNAQSPQWAKGVLDWHNEMGNYIKNLDEFDHIVSTSASDQQLFQMDTLSGLDLLQYHVYNQNLIPVILQKNKDFKSNLKKPIFCGEYGLNVQTADTPIDIQRNLIWAGIFDRVPHLMWLWDRYTDSTWSNLFKYPARFLKEHEQRTSSEGFDWKFSSDIQEFNTLGNKYGQNYYGMVFQPRTGVSNLGTTLNLASIANGIYEIEIMDMETGHKTKLQNTLAGSARKITIARLNKGQVFILKYIGLALEPVASLQGNAVVGQNSRWEINAEESYIPEGLTATYTWKFLKQPEGSTLTLSEGNRTKFDLTPTIPGDYQLVMGLIAGSFISYDTLDTYVNASPIAVISAPKTSKLNEEVQISADNSTDLENDTLKYQWKVTSPSGSIKVFSYSSQLGIKFISDIGGKYLVELLVKDDYTESKAATAEILTELALSTHFFEDEIKVYPVPARDYINFEVLGDRIGKTWNAEIINIGGAIISKIEVKKSGNIPLNLASGVYFLRLSNGSRTETKKFVVE